MDITTYAAEAEAQGHHWWFHGRRVLFSQEIDRFGIPRTASVLDVGTSTGSNLGMLRDAGFTNVVGLDSSPVAAEYCASRGLSPVVIGDAAAMEFRASQFDLILLTDVIEHVDNDAAVLAEAFRVIKPGGMVLITVPTFQFLWGLQDDVAHHRRRYRMRSLIAKVQTAGFAVERSYYFNYLLFLPIWLARQVIRILDVKLRSENEVGSPLINRILSVIFLVDITTAPWLRPPFGVSALVVARKPAQ